jgi:hypothetical protein
MIERLFQSKLLVSGSVIDDITDAIVPVQLTEFESMRIDRLLDGNYTNSSYYYEIVDYNNLSLFRMAAPDYLSLLTVSDLGSFGGKGWQTV